VVIMLLKKFNVDKHHYEPDFILRIKDFIDLVGGFNARHVTDILTRVCNLLIASKNSQERKNESVKGSSLGGNDAEIERERIKRREKEDRDAKKQEKDLRKQFEREKKKFTKQQKKRDRATERLVQNLVHSSDERHILAFPSFGACYGIESTHVLIQKGRDCQADVFDRLREVCCHPRDGVPQAEVDERQPGGCSAKDHGVHRAL
jgi:hypothetical protein